MCFKGLKTFSVGKSGCCFPAESQMLYHALLSLQLHPIAMPELFSLTLCGFFTLAEDHLPAGFPTIDMGPQLKVVEKARTATMLCAASGNPDPEISWFKDFLPVDTATSNGRIKQLRSGKVAEQVSLPYLLTLPPSSLAALIFSLKCNSKPKCQFDLSLFLLQYKTSFWSWSFLAGYHGLLKGDIRVDMCFGTSPGFLLQ